MSITKAQLEALTNNQQFAYAINTLRDQDGKQRNAFIQADGTLRLVTLTVAESKTLITRAANALSDALGRKVALEAKTYSMRFRRTNFSATVATRKGSVDSSCLDPATGLVIAGTSPEVLNSHKYQCASCGQHPLQPHTKTCKNKDTYTAK